MHLANYWPEWGIKLIDAVDGGRWQEIQRMLVEEAMPFYKLWIEIEKGYTSGDGYLDKLCMELVGLDFQPLPAADPRRARALSRALPADDAGDRRAAACVAGAGDARQPFMTLGPRATMSGSRSRKVAAGSTRVRRAGSCATSIPMGHKMALRPIAAGTKIHKFGVPIGRATARHRRRRAGARAQSRQRLSRQRRRPFEE